MIDAKNNRINAIDAAKGLGIISVVMCHTLYAENIQIILYAFHMPLFFMISGILFKPEKYQRFGDFIKTRLKTLICPYVLFCVFGIIFHLAEHISDGLSAQELGIWISESVLSIIWAPYSKYFNNMNTPLWFVPCLLLVEIMYFFISKIKNKKIMILLISVICAIGWFTESKYCPVSFSVLPWNFSSACFTLGFYAVGHLISPLLKEKVFGISYSGKQNLVSAAAIIILSAITVLLGFVNGKISIGSRELNNGFLLYITGFAGSFAILFLSRFFEKCRFIKFCGKNSFIIMGSHVLIRGVFKEAFDIVGSRFGICADDMGDFFIFICVLILSVIFTLLYIKIRDAIKAGKGIPSKV